MRRDIRHYCFSVAPPLNPYLLAPFKFLELLQCSRMLGESNKRWSNTKATFVNNNVDASLAIHVDVVVY